jgi:Holliday junction resolvasome RuvABC endonuclease subunit
MILALDLATQTGVCFGAADTGEIPTLDHFRLPSTGDDVGRFLAAFEDQINALIDRAAPTLIVFEAPVLPRAKFNPATKKVEGGVSIITTRKLQGLAGELERIAFRQGIECAEIQPSEAKQALTGKGNAKKAEMVRACRAFGLNPHTYTHQGEEASDEADAFGVWLCALRMRHPKLAGRWDPINFMAGRAA